MVISETLLSLRFEELLGVSVSIKMCVRRGIYNHEIVRKSDIPSDVSKAPGLVAVYCYQGLTY